MRDLVGFLSEIKTESVRMGCCADANWAPHTQHTTHNTRQKTHLPLIKSSCFPFIQKSRLCQGFIIHKNTSI